jgi:hypothetical protein
MTTIVLPADLEDRLAAEARKRGTTTEVLAVDCLRQFFIEPTHDEGSSSGKTLNDFLSGFIGTVNGTTEALSENCGQRFSDGLAEQQRRRRL